MISVTRLFRLGIRIAAWATPHVKEWHRQRHLNRNEGQRNLEARNWTEAEKYLSQALAERRHSASRRVELMLGLAKARRHQHKFSEAEQTVNAAIEAAVQARNQGLHSNSMEALADLQLDQGRYSEAEATIAEIARMEGAQSKPDHARLAKCSHKLGTALLKSERRAEAMEAFQHATQLSERAFGAEHIETANSLSELGAIYRRQGNHAEAQRHLRRAMHIHRTALGPDSREATQSLYHLAASLEESGDVDGAAEEFERLLALRARQVGADPQETADAQVRLATLYMQAGRPAPARELLTQAIGVLERKGGRRLADALETLASMDERMGRTEDAKRLRERASSLAIG